MVGYHVNKCKLVNTRLQLHSISLQDLIAYQILIKIEEYLLTKRFRKSQY